MDPARLTAVCYVERLGGDHADKHYRIRYRKERISDSRRGCKGPRRITEAAQTRLDYRLLREHTGVRDRNAVDGRCALLGASAERFRAHRAADCTAVGETVSETRGERQRQ